MGNHLFQAGANSICCSIFWIYSCPHANGTGDPVLCIDWKYPLYVFLGFAGFCGSLRKICGSFAGNSHRFFWFPPFSATMCEKSRSSLKALNYFEFSVQGRPRPNGSSSRTLELLHHKLAQPQPSTAEEPRSYLQSRGSSKILGKLEHGRGPLIRDGHLLVLPQVQIAFLEASIRPGIPHGKIVE